jgi:predicted transcriptional regulator of viral defense system
LQERTRQELRRLSRASTGGIIDIERSAIALNLSRIAAAERLAALRRRGWVERLRRGHYLILPLEADRALPVTVEDPWVLARELYAPCYIGGWSAAEHWKFTEQLFRSTFVVTAANIRSTVDHVLTTEFHLARIGPKRVEGASLVWRGRERVPVSDRELTLADALVSPAWVGGVRHLADMLYAYRDMPAADLRKILAHLEKIGRGAGFKRLGYLVETLFPEESDIIRRSLVHRSQGTIKLDPAVGARGKLDKRWGLWVNVHVLTSHE